MTTDRVSRRSVAVVASPDAPAAAVRSLVSVIGSLGHEVVLVALEEDARWVDAVGPVLRVPRLDVEVIPRYLDVSYRLHRALVGRAFDTIVFPDRGGHAYCCARARQLGVAYATTRVVVHCTGTTLRAMTEEGRSFISKGDAGTMAAERLSVRIADDVVCVDEDTLRWMREREWALPAEPLVPRDASDGSGPWADVLERPVARVRASVSGRAPSVSVVVTHHERPELLRACLAALATQTLQPAEVIVADDGSETAASHAALSSLEAASWPWRLEVLRLAHGGVHEARNAGWRAAAGELVLFVDDDDVPFDSLVETLVAARAASGADVVSSGSRTFHGIAAPVARAGDVISLKLGEPYELGVLSNHYGGPTCLWPRQLLEELGGFRGSDVLAEDWDILVRAALAGAEIVGTPEPLFWNRQLPGGRQNRSGLERRDRSLVTVAESFSRDAPASLAILPLLAAGAYEELERRKRASVTPYRRSLRRGRVLARRSREVVADEGFAALGRRIASFVLMLR